MRITIAGFNGEARAPHPLLLPDGVGVKSLNQNPNRGDLRPWNAPAAVASVPAGRKTIYRMGLDVASDANYWLSWPTIVHAVRGFNAEDSTEQTYFTGDGVPKWTDNTMALASAPYPTAARLLGVPAPATACTLVASGGTSTTVETRVYFYTYVTDRGEESAPSPSSLLLTCKLDDTVTINSLAAPPAGNYGINRIRIYRSQNSTDGVANAYFLREIASTLTSSTDDNRALGESLPSLTWLPPPANLKFLTGLWNGMMAGISGRSIVFCEAYKAYAWPVAYSILPPHSTPVALATFGQTLVALTNGNPIIISGGSPDSMDEQPLAYLQACVAPLSAVGMGHGVAWASPDGLAYAGTSAPRLLTEGILTKKDWQALKPETMQGCMYEGQYFGFYQPSPGVRKGFMLDPANTQGIYFLDFGVDALYLDELQDSQFVLDGTDIKKWDAGAALTVTFRSKPTRMTRPTPGFSCLEVVADAYPVTVIVDATTGAAEVSAMLAKYPTRFTAPDATTLRITTVVNSMDAVRLPAGYRMDSVQVEISSAGAVQGVALAHTMEELAQV